MPEGPEIRRAADRVAKAVVGVPLQEVSFANPELSESAELLSKSVVQAVHTVGKAMLTQFECGLTVYSHNQLYGRWYVVKRGKAPRSNRSLRWAMRSASHEALLYSASDISVWSTAKVHEHPFVAKAGPDLLSREVTVKSLADHMREARFARRSLGALLLDQSFVAGIGNYLRSEILFEARLTPDRKLGGLAPTQIQALAEATHTMIHRAYRSGGITNDLDKAKELKAQGLTRAKYRHHVFARGGAPCFTCGTRIEQYEVVGRRLYLCPYCQGEVVGLKVRTRAPELSATTQEV